MLFKPLHPRLWSALIVIALALTLLGTFALPPGRPSGASTAFAFAAFIGLFVAIAGRRSQ